jgi:UDP-N-acetylglucosamine 2-epimerase
MKKLKVLTVVGTRPEIIRLACVLQKLDASEAIEHVLVHTGQNYNYELNEVNLPTYLRQKVKRHF